MSLLPFSSLADELNHLTLHPYYADSIPYYYSHLPFWPLASKEKELFGDLEKNGGAVSKIGKDGFQVCMDVTQFKPNELNVKVVDNAVVVEGKHEEREDQHGYISRHFVRRYALPKGYEADKVVSTLSSDGVLTVSIPKPPAVKGKKDNERVIHIQQTGPAHLSVKKNPEEQE